MNLSEENLDKLKTFIKENNFVNNNSGKKPQEPNKSLNVDDSTKMFYSIIDNSDNLYGTSKENPLLNKSEDNFRNINTKKPNHSNNLTIEEELYDEFNYLLDE